MLLNSMNTWNVTSVKVVGTDGSPPMSPHRAIPQFFRLCVQGQAFSIMQIILYGRDQN